MKVTATISATGIQAGEQTIELFVRHNSDKFVKRRQATVTLDPNSAARVTIPIRGLIEPLNQGELRLISSDPLAFDDKTSFTVAVRPPPNVLIVGEANRRIDSEAFYLSEALAPEDEQFARASDARSRITYLPATKLESESGTLEEYDVVCLVNVRHPTERTWESLKSYVASGGGLLVVMGMPNGSNPPSAVAYNLPVAQSLLPAELLADLRFKPAENLDIKQRTHPIFSEIDEIGDFSELTSVNVNRYWRVKPAADASVIANYSDERSSPAVLERVHGKGRTLMFTTALDLNGWSGFPRVWQFVVMADEMVQYLGRFARNTHNYTAGEQVFVSLDPSKPLRRYLLRKPNLEQLPGDIAPNAESLTVRSVDQIGSYQLINAPGEPSYITGFSVNPPPGESDFTRMTTDDLDKLLGENRYSVSRDIAGLIRNVESGRIGQEIFSLVMFCMILVFCCEHIVANRFYDAEQNVGHL